MDIAAVIGRTFIAIIMAIMMGGLAIILIEGLAPVTPSEFLPISNVSALLGTVAAGLGAYWGWKDPLDIIDRFILEALGRLLTAWL